MTSTRTSRRTNSSNVSWLDSIPTHWAVLPSKRLFSETKQRALPDDEQLTASQAYGVIPQREYVERSGQSVVQITTNLELRKHVERDDFVISMRSFQGGLERAWATGCIRSSYVVLRPSKRVNVGYYTHLFKSHAYIQALQATSHFIRDGQDLNFGNFCLIDLPLPPQEAQRAIATFLDRKTAAIDALIAKKERLIELLQEKRQALITQAVTRGLDPTVPLKDSGDEWLGVVPAHWTLMKLGWLAQVGNGSTPSREEPDYWAESGYPWLNSSKVNADTAIDADRFVTSTAMRECHLPRVAPRSVLVAITGEGQTRGRAALLTSPATVSQHIAYITLRTLSLDPAFLHRHLQARYAWMRGESSGGGSTKAALTCEFLRSLRIAIPTQGEQENIVQRIGESLSSNDRLAGQTERSLDLLREYRQALITAAVTGMIDVSKEAA